MEQTFMTIHNLSSDANILFASESVVDILGYQPHEVQGKSCFDYFHPDEIPFARSVHNRGVLLDKAAVLHYARIMSKDGRWISCECCFTVVHDVLVASTSIYRWGKKSERRAIEAPQISRIFSCSPRDPRYHMLEHLSPKFVMPSTEREPRAALILNRFTRTLGIMFATNAISSILGIEAEELRGYSLYECIAEKCLADAIKSLESAKANDSIAYLRFWSRDPRTEDVIDDGDVEMDGQDDEATEAEFDSPVRLEDAMDDTSDHIKSEPIGSPQMSQATSVNELAAQDGARASRRQGTRRRVRRCELIPTRELEAVVSCTSDGLVMVLRQARPPIPSLHSPVLHEDFENGLFAAPWSEQSVPPNYSPESFYTPTPPPPQYMPVREHVPTASGPPNDQLMNSIREVAVFAWGLVGINGNLASHSHGNPSGESQPADGLPIWDPNAPTTSYLGPEPPSSRYPVNGLAPDHSADPGPSRHRVLGTGPTASEAQGHVGLGMSNSGNPGHPSPPAVWPSPSPMTPSSESRPYSHVQQQFQYRTTGRQSSIPQPQRSGGVRPETANPYGQPDENEAQSPATPARSVEETQRNARHVWK
ncbi:hypothetical protein GGR50DRAFT_695888 [Xylaria sp. CBS 124048]|nr:hypothetical protein GGR50DRAFT_695888 [Xylaria sp. CBS 124048]